MTNNQSNIEKEKSVLTVSKFLDEELEFLKEEGISIQGSNSKWSWLTNELAEKYFISVLLSYYIIKPNLIYDELYLLGFKGFILKFQKLGFSFSQIKNYYTSLNDQNKKNLLVEKFGLEKANKKLEYAKNRLNKLPNLVSSSSITSLRVKLKVFFDLGFSPIKCQECNVGMELFIALQLHHPTKSKEISLPDFYRISKEKYNLLLQRLKDDYVILLCDNHHREKHVFYPIEFKEIILKKDLFLMSAEEIDAFIDDYLSAFSTTEKYQEVIYEKYISQNKIIPKGIIIRWKYQIKKWIKKRFVFEQLFNGKCIICGDTNLSHIAFHHLDSDLKESEQFWQSIASFNCNKIINILIEQKCVSICSNCHQVISYKFHLSIKEVLKEFFSSKEIDKLSNEVLLNYNNAIGKVLNFKYDMTKINIKDPLKLEVSINDIWKIHLIRIYFYLEIKERSFFFRNEILYDLELNRSIFDRIEKMIEMNYILKSGKFNRYSLTKEGKEKANELVKEYFKIANKIKEKIKVLLSNKGKYDYLDYLFSDKDKKFIRKKSYTEDEIRLKYCLIIFDLISKKGVNEFTSSELAPLLNCKDRFDSINRNLGDKLLPYNLIEEIEFEKTTSYYRLNPHTKNEASKIPISASSKIYRLTKKGIDLVEIGFESLI